MPSRRASTADQIKDYILTQGLHPGDHLPTESELCERLGVSRSSVREAIQTLSTLDIVEVRHGRGTFVGRMSLDALVEALVFRGVLSPGDDLQALREVLEIRQALDLSMAERIVAALRGTANPSLHDLVDQMVASATAGETFAPQDRLFHTELLGHIDNSLVGQLVTAFWDVHTAVLPRLGLTLPADLDQTARAHRDMLEAAEAGDVDAFRTAVVDHYAPLQRMLDEARPPREDARGAGR
ncbi:GntR family transcriptional regulator [Georgenia soli]|uniref:GntR family transcriptional regulator n=2 Tax=Georgenia soli TaxID=638953 RepID=A0A2A9EHS7_9MICO|nr:GntR family transcriptional regulator [Georgenia soli]PFG38627.1 GntR family transcriptional regulator [Georgenia soli]